MSKTAVMIVAMCGLAMPALAQDSVSRHQGLPGDAIDPYAVGEQVNRYVVDLQTLRSSWGNEFGIGPLVKVGKSPQANFFTMFAGSQAMSHTLIYNTRFPANSYASWTAAGQGVNASNNNAPGSENTTCQRGLQFAVAGQDTEFVRDGGGNQIADHAGIFTAVVNYDPNDPTHLYVTRTAAANNGTSYNGDNARVYLGSVDDSGNVQFRADGLNANGSDAFTSSENNWFRVDSLARNSGAINSIGKSFGLSDAPASTWIDLDPGFPNNYITITHNPPSIMPESLFGRPIAIGGDFNDEYVWESSAGTTSLTTAHLGVEDDHRGNAYFTRHAAFTGASGTVGMLGHSVGSPSVADAMIIWGVNSNGDVVAGKTRQLLPPASITDNNTGVASLADIGPWDEFGNFRSQVAFQGGNGQVAIGRDQQGRTLVAGMMKVNGGLTCPVSAERDANPTNSIIVARITGDAAGGAVEWGMAAYNFSVASGGKPLTDGAGNTVGRLVELYTLTGAADCNDGVEFGNPFGPSMSAPAMDSVGNLYFLASAELYDENGQVRDVDVVLVRAVYTPSNFSYELELLLEPGWVFNGLNSTVPYQIRFLEIADSNSAASSTLWSGNIMQAAAHGRSTSGLATRDPATLGGLTLWARIVYDANLDGDFDDTDVDSGDPTPADESYATLLFIGPKAPGFFCPADLDGSRTVNVFDFLEFQTLFSEGSLDADFDCSNSLNVFDFLAFQTAFSSC